MPSGPTCLLLVLPLVSYDVEGVLFLDQQACNGLRLWLRNFNGVILCTPVLSAMAAPAGTVDVRAMFAGEALEIHLLPVAYTPLAFAGVAKVTSRTLRSLIARATHLQFALGGLWGDWGAVAAILARRAGRPAAVWTDRVESQVMQFQARTFRGPRRWYRLLNAWLTTHFERWVIRRAELGLFHGMDTFTAYARFSARPQLVHDIHLGPEFRISEEALAAKIDRPADMPLRIIYGGRAHPDKGVLDWIEALRLTDKAGIAFTAIWYGIGPELEHARAAVQASRLGDVIDFPGAASSHEALMQELRAADIMLFCHKTAESPRCLVEALLSGTPILGYRSAYPADLIAEHGGGVLTGANPSALAAALIALDRPELGKLARRAAADGHPMVDVDVFHHRSELIKSL